MSGACSEIIDDIEDLISSQDITPKERYASRKTVNVRSKKPHKKETEEVDKVILESVVPGTQTIYVKTWGCAHNSSDSEYMAGLLAAQGYQLTEDKWAAQLWLLNSCTVKNPAEEHFRNEVAAARARGRHVVLAGCVPQGAPRSPHLRHLSVVGVQQIDRIVEVVEETLKGNTVRLLGERRTAAGGRAGGAPLQLPKVRRNPLVEIIAISTGCLNQCTYCKTRHARGALGSYPPEEILQRAQEAFSEGVVEVWLTSEDTGAYGRDIGTSLPALLRSLAGAVPPGCRLRLGMTNPPYILEHLPDIAEVMRHPRVYKFLHVPVQAGSDQVLADMRREYTRADFERVVDYLRAEVPGITIATDIICGFPTETAADFAETVALCERHRFPSLFVNQFFPRPGTPAAAMPRVNTQEVKRRTKQLSELFRSYSPYAGRAGETHDVLVTDASHDGRHLVGHNDYYEQVLVPKRAEYMGKLLRVRITAVSKFSMMGEPLQRPSAPGLTAPLKKGEVSGLRRVTDGNRLTGDSRLNGKLPALVLLAVLFARLVWVFLL